VGATARGLYENTLSPFFIKLPIEDLLPRAKVEPPFGDGDHHLSAHDLRLRVGVPVILAGRVVSALEGRFLRGKLLEPRFTT
jgi:hypothetical protein